jgi:NAD(P)-dependent dehydrogenase (short-subunit alcohol dehydrogenase family)
MKSIVITGSSSGIGKATAKHFAQQGWRVAATMRKPENETELTEIENISLYQLDVTNDASIAAATEQILSDFGTVDVLLNNAGYGLMGTFEAASPEQIKRQFDTNVFGLMAVTRAFLPHFRANQSGLILNVSSIGGRITFPFMSLYHSTKWAVEGFSESLSYELGTQGIQVKIIEPGGVSTDFAGRSLDFATKEGLSAYDEPMGKFRAAMGNSGLGGSTAEYQAEHIYVAATDGKNQLRYLIGEDAVQTYAMREEAGDDAFIAGMKQRTLS